MPKINYITNSIIIALSLSTVGCTQSNSNTKHSWFNMDRRTAGTMVDDQAITLKANLAIVQNKDVWKNSHISTLSYNNSLLIVGQTKTQNNKYELEKLLEPIAEIGNIYNQVTVESPIPLKTRANDTWITTQVKAKLIASREVGINRVKVITENGTVYLMGMLTAEEENNVTDIVRRIDGVNKVVTIFERTAKN